MHRCASTTWDENQLVASGVVRVREVDLDFETEEVGRCRLNTAWARACTRGHPARS